MDVHSTTVTWTPCARSSDVVRPAGLRPKKIGRGLGLAGLVLYCETRSCTRSIAIIMILKDTETYYL